MTALNDVNELYIYKINCNIIVDPVRVACLLTFYSLRVSSIGPGKLCRHNLEHNRLGP